MDARSVSVLLAAYNEAPSIAAVVAGCRAAVPDLVEVLVIDDGSTDATAAEAERAGARVLRLPGNRGKGFATRHGIAHARGDVLVFLDADGQDDPAEIPLLLDALRDGVDLVIGSRFIGRFAPGAITRVNRLGTRFLTGVVNVLFRSSVTDSLAGFRCATRRACLRAGLRAGRYDIEVDLLCGILRNGGRVVEVPVGRAPRAHGKTHLNAVLDGTRILARIVERRFV